MNENFDFQLSMEDYTIIVNALHYYKKVEKVERFRQYDESRINELRDKLANQLIPNEFNFSEYNDVIDKK